MVSSSESEFKPWLGSFHRIPGQGTTGTVSRILHCDWLPEQARWSYLARLGLPTVSRKKNFSESHIINPLLTKLRSVKMAGYIGLVLFLQVYEP